MNISVDISLYPLDQDYKPKINAFLEQLNRQSNDLDIRTSNMSTRVFGQYQQVTDALNSAMKFSMENHGKLVFVCKYLSSDARELSGYD